MRLPERLGDALLIAARARTTVDADAKSGLSLPSASNYYIPCALLGMMAEILDEQLSSVEFQFQDEEMPVDGGRCHLWGPTALVRL